MRNHRSVQVSASVDKLRLIDVEQRINSDERRLMDALRALKISSISSIARRQTCERANNSADDSEIITRTHSIAIRLRKVNSNFVPRRMSRSFVVFN